MDWKYWALQKNADAILEKLGIKREQYSRFISGLSKSLSEEDLDALYDDAYHYPITPSHSKEHILPQKELLSEKDAFKAMEEAKNQVRAKHRKLLAEGQDHQNEKLRAKKQFDDMLASNPRLAEALARTRRTPDQARQEWMNAKSKDFLDKRMKEIEDDVGHPINDDMADAANVAHRDFLIENRRRARHNEEHGWRQDSYDDQIKQNREQNIKMHNENMAKVSKRKSILENLDPFQAKDIPMKIVMASKINPVGEDEEIAELRRMYDSASNSLDKEDIANEMRKRQKELKQKSHKVLVTNHTPDKLIADDGAYQTIPAETRVENESAGESYDVWANKSKRKNKDMATYLASHCEELTPHPMKHNELCSLSGNPRTHRLTLQDHTGKHYDVFVDEGEFNSLFDSNGKLQQKYFKPNKDHLLPTNREVGHPTLNRYPGIASGRESVPNFREFI